MISPTEIRHTGLEYLEAVTSLLNRVRTIHPTAGLYEAADLQWWWGQFSRSTDDLEQLFWFDDDGRPLAAIIVTDWHGDAQLHPIFLPDATPEWVTYVMDRGLAHANAFGIDKVQLEVDKVDEVLHNVLRDRGFVVEENGLTESWIAADSRPPVSPLPEGYQLFDRGSVPGRPHHMINEARNHPDSEPRLKQTSLYRSDLDLVVYDKNEQVGGYGLFWYNPTTGVGMAEPMRTEEGHQQRGIARHILTSGIDRLARAGAERIKICFDPDNEPAKHLYLDIGFRPERENDLFGGPTATS